MVLEIDHKEARPGVVVVSMTGKLQLGPESQKLESLIPQLIAEGYKGFVFDLGGVSHIDSTGIGRCIYSFNKVAQARGTPVDGGGERPGSGRLPSYSTR